MPAPDIVDTAAEAAELELPPLIVREPFAAFLDEHGLGEGELEAERIGEGHSNVTFLIRRGDRRLVLRRPPRPPLPPSAHDVLREARVLCGGGGHRGARARGARRVRRRVGARRALLRDGGGERQRGHRHHPASARQSGGARADRPGADRRARRDPRGRLARLRPRGLRQAHRLPGAPAAPLRTGCGSTTRPASCRACRSSATGSRRNLPESPAATIVHGDYRLGNVMVADDAPGRRGRRSSTGSWPRSAIRWPTWAT